MVTEAGIAEANLGGTFSFIMKASGSFLSFFNNLPTTLIFKNSGTPN
jgi:hypothetical protein